MGLTGVAGEGRTPTQARAKPQAWRLWWWPGKAAAAAGAPTAEGNSNVSECTLLPFHWDRLVNTPFNFVAGKTRRFLNKWREHTSDRKILSYVSGVHIDFSTEIQGGIMFPLSFFLRRRNN